MYVGHLFTQLFTVEHCTTVSIQQGKQNASARLDMMGAIHDHTDFLGALIEKFTLHTDAAKIVAGTYAST